MSREVASDDHLESNGLTGVANGNIRMWRVQFPRGNDVRNRIEEIARYAIEDLTFVWNSFGENDIKRADSVGYHGNHEVRADGIHVPDFAVIGRSLTREVELRMFES